MSKTILDILGTSTPVSEMVAKKLGLIRAAIVCRVFFYQQLRDGVCRATNKSFQDALGLSGGTVSSNLSWLLENGYIINTQPLVKGNRPNHYKVTPKFYALLDAPRSPDERNVHQMNVDVHQVNGKEESEEESKESTTTEKFNIFSFYTDNFASTLSPYNTDLLKEVETDYPITWVEHAMKQAVKLNKRSLGYVEAILKKIEANGGKLEYDAPGKRNGYNPYPKARHKTKILNKFSGQMEEVDV